MTGDHLEVNGEKIPKSEALMPMTYDIMRDEMRPVTQADVDRWQAMERAYTAFRNSLRLLLGDRELLRRVVWEDESAFMKAAGQKIYDLRYEK